MVQKEDCPFCQIARGEMDTELLLDEENLVAFEDLDPQAPVHVLIIPRDHVTSDTDLSPQMLKQLIDATQKIAQRQGIVESGYATRINHGEDAGQMVDHLHVHVVGGRELGFP
jgi:histidine triad (HIT) family protein